MALTLLRATRRHARAGSVSLRAGGSLLGVLIALSVFTRIALPDPNGQVLTDANLPPFSPGHLLGTDSLGRDLFLWCTTA